MQSSFERRRLLKIMHDEPASVWMVLAECTAGLAVIALITVIGYSDNAAPDRAPPPPPPPGARAGRGGEKREH